MLKYLMKYDLKKMLKLLIWLYPVAIILAGITRILNIWNNIQFIRIIGIIFSGFTYSAIANVLVNTFIHILMRFSHSFYKDESYLTHTLPVRKNSLILSKYLSSLIVILLSVIVSFLSLFILFYSSEFVESIKIALESVVSGLNISGGLFIFISVILIFAEICLLISFAFTAIVKAYSYSHNRGIKGFAWFIIYYLATSNITLLLSVIVMAITGDLNSLFANQMSSSAFITLLIISLISYISFSIIFYFICQKEFNKGVNID